MSGKRRTGEMEEKRGTSAQDRDVATVFPVPSALNRLAAKFTCQINPVGLGRETISLQSARPSSLTADSCHSF